ncbi:MAG: tetratricopeptide repeat protein, partial [Phycisphaerales bacterium]
RAAEGYGRGVKEVCNNIGSVLAEYGHDPPAVDYYARAAGMDKHYALPRWNLFRLFKRHGRYAEAREQLEQIIAATPDDFRAYGEMGFLLHNHLDDPDAAVRFWHESLRIKPDQPQIIEALASRSTSLDR